MIVADASVVLAFMIDDENVVYADAAVKLLADEGAVVPGNFHGEVAQGLLQAERRGRIDESRATNALRHILALPIVIETIDVQQAMRLARRHALTVYDASYLALAEDTALPLATTDAVLAKAAASLRVLWRPAAT